MWFWTQVTTDVHMAHKPSLYISLNILEAMGRLIMNLATYFGFLVFFMIFMMTSYFPLFLWKLTQMLKPKMSHRFDTSSTFI
jgi:hypothetical protein